MNRTRQILFTILGISFALLLFLLAMSLPKLINAFLDKKTLNKATYRNTSLKTYEVSYDSFRKKLHAIACCDKERLHAIQVKETNAQENTKITKIVQKELDFLAQSTELFSEIKLKPASLSSCETFTLYNSNDTKRLKGITYWKITYQQKKETFLFYLDEEYHKIYALEMTRKADAFPYLSFALSTAASRAYSKSWPAIPLGLDASPSDGDSFFAKEEKQEYLKKEGHEYHAYRTGGKEDQLMEDTVYYSILRLAKYYGLNLEDVSILSSPQAANSFYTQLVFTTDNAFLETIFQFKQKTRKNIPYITWQFGLFLKPFDIFS